MDERLARHEAAVVARTVLSTCHESFCERLDGAEHASTGVVGLLAAGPQPFLVPSDPTRFFPTGTALACRVRIPDVGIVRCVGTTGSSLVAAEHPGVAKSLEDHRGCLVGPVDATTLRVVPLQVFELAVGSCDGGRSACLTPAELAAAAPDWLLARGRALTAHLEQDHADDLRDLAEARGVTGASAVSLARLSTRGARLVCLGDDGVTSVDLVFDPPVREPAELWRRMASA